MDVFNCNNRNQAFSIITAISVTFGAYYLFKNKTDKEKKGFKTIPEPKSKLPIVGHLFSLGKILGYTVANWHSEYGPILSFNIASKKFITISDPELAHQIFVTNGSVTSNRGYNPYFTEFYSCGGKGIVFSNTDKRWKRTRGAVASVFTPHKVDEFKDMITQEADQLMDRLLKDSKSLGPIDPSDYYNIVTLNVMLQTTFGKKVSSMEDPFYKEMMAIVEESVQLGRLASDITTLFPFLSFLNVFSKKQQRFHHFTYKIHHPFYKRIIEEAMESNRNCFVRKLYDLKDEYDLDDENIAVTVSDIIGAGSESTANSIKWGTAILSHYPEVQEKLRNEIDAFIKKHNRLPNFNEREELPYLIAVQKECLRYKPVSSLGVPHVVEKDVVVQNYFIPKDSILATSMVAMHKNPNVYDDPDTFNPDRFLNDVSTFTSSANGKIQNRDQYNFGWGRRLCLGIYLAETEMFYVYTRLFAFSIIAPPLDENGNEVPVDISQGLDGGISLMPIPFKVRFLERSDALLQRKQ
ncbi:cytochrome P450 [Cunninghamella echinulata]|nr:cytochrome P450 [Cunninghamella echinulata]